MLVFFFAFSWRTYFVSLQGVSTLRRAVWGEKQNSSGNLKISQGIKRLGKFFGRHKVIELKFREVGDFLGMSPKNLG